MYIFFPKTTKNLQHIRVYVDNKGGELIYACVFYNRMRRIRSAWPASPKCAGALQKMLHTMPSTHYRAGRIFRPILGRRGKAKPKIQGRLFMSFKGIYEYLDIRVQVVTTVLMPVTTPHVKNDSSSSRPDRRLPRDWARWFG